MKKNIIIFVFFCFLTNGFAANSISLVGGISTPIKENQKKFFNNAPYIDLGYTYTFNNHLLLGTDIGFIYQKENPEKLLFKNFLIDITANIGYSFDINNISIIPQLCVGYAKYFFYEISDYPPKKVNFICYGATLDFSYSFSDIIKVIIRPELTFYGNDYLTPLKISAGIGIDF